MKLFKSKDNNSMLKVLGFSILGGIIATFIIQKATKKPVASRGSLSRMVRSNIARSFPVIAEQGPTTGYGPESVNTANGGTFPSFQGFPKYPSLWNISPAAPVTGNNMTFVGGLGFGRDENSGFPIAY